MTGLQTTKRLAVFDCDGTLVDGQANICRAMAAAFDRSALPPPPDAATRAIVGLSLPEAMRVLLPDADAETLARLTADYREVYRALRTAGALEPEPLFDGVAELLDRLRDDGWVLGVATGKSDRGLAHVLAAHGIADRFATLQTADRHPSKPDPAMLRVAMAEAGATPDGTAMIGDTAFDMAMARGAGARAVGVAWGYHAVSELLAAGAAGVAERPDQIPALLVRP